MKWLKRIIRRDPPPPEWEWIRRHVRGYVRSVYDCSNMSADVWAHLALRHWTHDAKIILCRRNYRTGKDHAIVRVANAAHVWYIDPARRRWWHQLSNPYAADYAAFTDVDNRRILVDHEYTGQFYERDHGGHIVPVQTA